jgi:hypothetical protein
LNISADIRVTLFEKGAPAEVTISAGTAIAMQLEIDAIASTLYLDWPCSIEISSSTDGNFSLTLDNITFEDRVSMQIRYIGADTLTLVATNGTVLDAAKIGTPYGGTVVIQTPATFTIANIPVGAEVRIYDDEVLGDNQYNTELAGVETNSGTTFQYSHNGIANAILVQVLASGYVESDILFTLGSQNQTLTLAPEVETNE